MLVHFVVCSLANSDGWKYFQELSPETILQFFSWFDKRKLLTCTYSVNQVLLRGTVPLSIIKDKNWDLAEQMFTRTVLKKNLQ